MIPKQHSASAHPIATPTGDAYGGPSIAAPGAEQPAPSGIAAVKTDTSGRTHPQYAEACAVVRKHKRGSISLVQRHLRIGWNTAAMLLEAMVGDVIAEMPPTTKMLPQPTGVQP